MDLNVFSKFPVWSGDEPTGYEADFIGHFIKREYRSRVARRPKAEQPLREPQPPIPLDDEIFEWIAVLESVLDAKDTFSTVELGAGYGRWTARAACALRQVRPDVRGSHIAVEAEPTHFAWLKEHLQYNEVSEDRCTLVQAPVMGERSIVHFTIGHPYEWYGQTVLPTHDTGYGNWPDASVVEMQSVTIPDLIRDLRVVDLIDMDAQGAELSCVEKSVGTLNRKVKRLYISTHSDDIHAKIDAILRRSGWENEVSYSPARTHDTVFGSINFQDGIQYWVNPRFGRRHSGFLHRVLSMLARE
jgi:FkbM family methyltransferase